MIGKLTGKLLEKHPPHILLDVHGVGYELDVPMSTLYVLPHAGETASLYTHFVVREDAQLLYGFATRGERETFRQLVKVSGIGPKIALAVLSGLTADELAMAVERDDAPRLAKVPGIGKKTAERLILELRGKLAGTTALHAHAAGLFVAPASARDDVVNALLGLGYNEREANAAIKGMPDDVSVNDGIRMALKSLAKV
ncbi:Holliday junction branch migration protein RuvA [Chitinimonas arctica]|uniref:Holliday junction branch migration complex subunit RuvA n=1 Tax=Chitinimonas arctica TaxID=2594795 RepID=A0A516SFN8_9NEIS|nr:Holliday junction branch migration protein RuvA [Chitinimonas arctica]QDQ26969.1 Holliday junction branch migration protein RuvA [Chitinimonas arctica]